MKKVLILFALAIIVNAIFVCIVSGFLYGVSCLAGYAFNFSTLTYIQCLVITIVLWTIKFLWRLK